jgi:hypothetical protein
MKSKNRGNAQPIPSSIQKRLEDPAARFRIFILYIFFAFVQRKSDFATLKKRYY